MYMLLLMLDLFAGQHSHGVKGGFAAHWPRLFNFTTDGKLDAQAYARHQMQWSPTRKVNTHENAVHHMLQLRTVIPLHAQPGIGYDPLQTFAYYHMARRLTSRLRQASRPRWPIVCEVGFGTGMSTSVLATATSSPHTSLLGGSHYVFDCRYCAGLAGGKTASWKYLQAVFGDRLELIEGESDTTIKHFADAHANVMCDIISIDGSHTHPQVLDDVRQAHALAHDRSIVLIDDLQDSRVNRSVMAAVRQGLITITQVFHAEAELDGVFASNRLRVDPFGSNLGASRGSPAGGAEAAATRVFVVARFRTHVSLPRWMAT